MGFKDSDWVSKFNLEGKVVKTTDEVGDGDTGRVYKGWQWILNRKSRAHYFGTLTIFRKVLYIEKKGVLSRTRTCLF